LRSSQDDGARRSALQSDHVFKQAFAQLTSGFRSQ
jgi:hypothetical protein